ncbi:MAG: hypothetical protein JEZ01_03890 [Labilibaculum sp.]|nr:hypothetical protein [Labilibaculum sp.]MBI9056896.1 hypothetical protein [Labilibaculum sp.]
MKTNSCSLWKLSIIIIVLFSCSTEVNAQFASIATKQIKVLSPIMKIATETIYGGNSEMPRLDLNSDREKSYISSSLFLFKENIQLCKDIITGKNDSLCTTKQKSEIPKQIKADTTDIIKEPKRILKKRKSFWNHPGNTKTRI